jgi:hypothetical protein
MSDTLKAVAAELGLAEDADEATVTGRREGAEGRRPTP